MFTIAFVDRFCDVAKRSEYTVRFGPHLLTFRQGVAKADEEAAKYIKDHASRRYTVLDVDDEPLKTKAVEDGVNTPTETPKQRRTPGAAVGEVVDDPKPKKAKKKTKSKKGKK